MLFGTGESVLGGGGGRDSNVRWDACPAALGQLALVTRSKPSVARRRK
jgi:hypothetical protein